MGGFPSLTQCAQNWVYFWEFDKKNHPIWSNWVFFCKNGILKGLRIVLFIGIANCDFLKLGRHIHVPNLGAYPLSSQLTFFQVLNQDQSDHAYRQPNKIMVYLTFHK